MGKLDGKTVLVTGASRGIGAETARLFAAEGGRVVCAARTLREGDHPLDGSLDTTVAAIRAAGGTAHPVAANIAEQIAVLILFLWTSLQTRREAGILSYRLAP